MHKFKQQIKRLSSNTEKAQAVGKRTSANKRRQAEASGDCDEAEASKDQQASGGDEQPSEDDEQASEVIYNDYSGFFPVVEVYSRTDSKRPEGSQKHKTL
ncbi:hypothetical protein LTR28_010245 [Elasticomyces elasticus]|nr:hypothetical protein LTR28_010245 [Elasticomyces elasticus]